jgi:hypothetical protein
MPVFSAPWVIAGRRLLAPGPFGVDLLDADPDGWERWSQAGAGATWVDGAQAWPAR